MTEFQPLGPFLDVRVLMKEPTDLLSGMVFKHQQHKPFVDAEIALANPRLTVLSFGSVAVGAVGRRPYSLREFCARLRSDGAV